MHEISFLTKGSSINETLKRTSKKFKTIRPPKNFKKFHLFKYKNQAYFLPAIDVAAHYFIFLYFNRQKGYLGRTKNIWVELPPKFHCIIGKMLDCSFAHEKID